MTKDLTGVLLPKAQLPEEEIRRRVLERLQRDVILRVAPLDAVGLVQVEVHSAEDGMPCEDPELVARLSQGGRAAFVHVNHGAKQAMVHGFVDGTPREGFAGEPGEAFEAKLREALDVGPFAAIVAADDGSRLGIGVTSSRTVALVRGAELVLPPGTPTDFNSFVFHDAGRGLDEGERVAFFAFDGRAAWSVLQTMPGAQLAELLGSAPLGLYGPLEAARAPGCAALAALGDKSAAQADLRDVRALELCALAAGRVFAGGDVVSYWDERVLPLFSLAAEEPKIDAADVDDLEDTDSILHAVVEVMPYAAPPGGEGPILSLIGPDELKPLAPWVQAGEEVSGSIAVVHGARLLERVRRLDGNSLNALIQKFERAWYRAARPGQPEGDAFETFRRAKAEEGREDVERVLRDWTELRIVLEIAAANRLDVGLLFYEA